MSERELFESWVTNSGHPMGRYLRHGAVKFDDIIHKYRGPMGTSSASNQMQVMLEAWEARARHENR